MDPARKLWGCISVEAREAVRDDHQRADNFGKSRIFIRDRLQRTSGKWGGCIYARYPIVARAWPSGCIGRVRRASKGILHTNGEGVVLKFRTFPDGGGGGL